MSDAVLFVIIVAVISPITLGFMYWRFGAGLVFKVNISQTIPNLLVAAAGFYLGSEGITLERVLIACVVVIPVTTYIPFWFQKTFLDPVVDQSTALRTLLEDRDLTVDVKRSAREDEIGELQNAFAELVETLRSAMGELSEGADGVRSASTLLLDTATRSSSTAAEQASTVTQVGATIEEINRTSDAAAQTAGEVVNVAEDALARGKEGERVVSDAVAIIDEVRSEVVDVATRISQLSAQHRRIGDIVVAVRDLSEQSNLLAVNASIEAAKAGEHGRGFSVVADEVRRLAEQSKQAMREVRSLLDAINLSSEAAVTAAARCKDRALEGRRAVDSVRDVVGALSGVLEDSARKARSIMGSTRQQSSGIAQIAQAMDAVAQGGRDNADAATSLQDSVASLTELSERLMSHAASFTVRPGAA